MTIDIISYSDSQFAQMTEKQILEVRSAQQRKNKLAEKLEQNKKNEKYRLLKNGTFRSCIYQKICEELDSAFEKEVENIREQLLFYLRFVIKPEENGDGGMPYLVDYSLDYIDRFNIVKAYYLSEYTDKKARMDAYSNDDVAKAYLGEYYLTLYDYLNAV